MRRPLAVPSEAFMARRSYSPLTRLLDFGSGECGSENARTAKVPSLFTSCDWAFYCSTKLRDESDLILWQQGGKELTAGKFNRNDFNSENLSFIIQEYTDPILPNYDYNYKQLLLLHLTSCQRNENTVWSSLKASYIMQPNTTFLLYCNIFSSVINSYNSLFV